MIMRGMYDWPTVRDTFSEIERMKSQMDGLFGGLTGSVPTGYSPGVFPSLNITEDKDTLYVRAELPGMKSDRIDISATNNKLSIAGGREMASEAEGASYHRREREAGTFRRSVTLPYDIDPGRVEARYTDGVLTVALPKAEAAKPKQISVRAS